MLTSRPEAAGNPTPLVCFAPNPYSGNYYLFVYGGLGSDRTMLALDYPGIGQSDTYPGEMDMGTLAEIMADSLTSLGWGPDGNGPVDLCGYHTGTMLATELAVTHPELVGDPLDGHPLITMRRAGKTVRSARSVEPWPDSSPRWPRLDIRRRDAQRESVAGARLRKHSDRWAGRARPESMARYSSTRRGTAPL
ncbi:MAG: hypothetical protein CM15mP103_12290 [Gammaproteobacteria bacterium]|nr:MAG: hypothetical protein CM15mP103_12290 [Gammaproteobacteria bacterium]